VSRPRDEKVSPRIPNLILFDTGANWDGPWMAFQHIASYLAKRTPVLFVDAPRSPVYVLRHEHRLFLRSRLRVISPNLYRLSPVAPPGWSRPGVRHLTRIVVRRAVRRAIAKLDAEVHAVLSNAATVDLFDIGNAKVRVYYVSDDFEAGADLLGRPVAQMVAREAEGVAGSDVIVAISERIAEKFRARGHDVILVANGVAADAFAHVDETTRPGEVDLPEPIAGYIGHIGDRIDISLLEATVDAGVSLLLVGPRQGTFSQDARLTRLLERSNVQWVGPKRFEELPPYVGLMDVGLVPYVDSAFNRASFPLKTLEYLAAGRAVVATPLPAIVWLATDLIATATSPDEFGHAVAKVAHSPRTPEVVTARRSFAESHSWSSRVDQLATILGLDAD